jgi:hypothetical protein
MIVRPKSLFLKPVVEQHLAQLNVELESWQADGPPEPTIDPLHLQPGETA